VELHRVFNCGIGMVAVVGARDADAALKLLKASGETAWRIGSIVERDKNGPQVLLV
jgi:phosphoribosylformylglycinamidine cyclo-ligase